MKKKIIIYAAVLAAAVTAVFSIRKSGPGGSHSEADNTDDDIQPVEDDSVIYNPSSEDIAYDEDENCLYYDNIINVYLVDEISSSEADSLASSVNGEVAGKVTGSYMNFLQVRTPESDLNELNESAENLMKSDDVLFACYTVPFCAGTSEISDKKNTASSEDWWVNAIHASEAWDLCRENKQKNVAVGIVDTGFDLNHEDLTDSSGNPVIKMLNENTFDKADNAHGTEVAGPVCAQNNGIGIRGVADKAKFFGVDWTDGNKSRLSSSTDENMSFLTSSWLGKYINQMAVTASSEGMPLVINNSWGLPIYSVDGFREDTYKKKSMDPLMAMLQNLSVTANGSYDLYLSWHEKMVERTGLECSMIIIQLLLNGYDDFLIVNAAGNGYDNGGKGYEAKYNGYFNSVESSCYSRYIPVNVQDCLRNRGIQFDTVRDHIIITAGVRDSVKDGKYELTEFSNYGENVDIAAPAQDIYTTAPGSVYEFENGTSFAAPQVSGAAALIWSLNPDASAAEIRRYLLSSTSRAVGVTKQSGNSKSDIGVPYVMLNVAESAQAVLDDLKEPKKEDSDASEPSDITDHTVKYAVSVYDMNKDGPDTLTFGPAVGIDSSHYIREEKPAHIDLDDETETDKCIHNHSWNEIISQAKTNPEAFRKCIAEGCTKTVNIELNDTLISDLRNVAENETGDGPSMLCKELKEDWRVWSPGGAQHGWEKSRIRAVLNGSENVYDISPQNEVGLDEKQLEDIGQITSQNCLLSCFPKELQEGIVYKNSGTCSDLYDSSSITYTDDKLWLFSGSELYTKGEYINSLLIQGEGLPYKKCEDAGITDRSYTALKPDWYDTADNKITDVYGFWLRTMHPGIMMYDRKSETAAQVVDIFGGLDEEETNITQAGIAPGFAVGTGYSDEEFY